MDDSDPTAIALVQAIRTGDLAALYQLLDERPGLVSEQVHGTGGYQERPDHRPHAVRVRVVSHHRDQGVRPADGLPDSQ